MVWVAEHVTVSTEPDARPASLKLHTSDWPLRVADDAFLMKCALPAAHAPDAATATSASSAAARDRVFLMAPPWLARGLLAAVALSQRAFAICLTVLDPPRA